MHKRHRSSRIIDIALASAGIGASPKCRQKLNFDVSQPAPASDRRDSTLVGNSEQEPKNYSMDTAQDYGGIVPLTSVVQNDSQSVGFIPSPSNDYIVLQNTSQNVKVGKENATVVITIDEADQQGTDLSFVDHERGNLNTNFTKSDLTLIPIDQPSTSTGLIGEPMPHDHIPNDNPIIDEGDNAAQPSNSIGPDTPNIQTSSTETAVIEVQSNSKNISLSKKNTRKCRIDIKYIDYMSDHEDFSTFYGDIDDSDDWSKGQRESDEETDDQDSTGKKNKSFRRRKTKTNESADQQETVGDSGIRVRKVNERKERAKKKKSGEEYTTKKGVIVPAKKILPNPCQGKRCGNDCGSIPEERRENIFKHFIPLLL